MSEVVDVINELKNLLEVCDKLSIYKNEKEKEALISSIQRAIWCANNLLV